MLARKKHVNLSFDLMVTADIEMTIFHGFISVGKENGPI